MYHGYRKPSHALRVWIILLAVLCILAAIVLVVLLQSISIDENNVKVLRIPFTDRVISLEGDAPTAAPEPEPEPEPEPAASTAPVASERIETSVLIPYSVLFDEAKRDALLHALRGSQINTVVLEVKPVSGKLAFPGSHVLAKPASAESAVPLTTLRDTLTAAGYQVVASVSCFRDNLAPRDNPALACQNRDGTLWGDAMRYTWLNPYSADVRAYLTALVSDLYALGFHEIRLTDLSFPVAEDADLIQYEDGQDILAAKREQISAFLNELAEAADGLPDLTLSARYDAAEGQSAQAFSNLFYRIYLPVTPDQNELGVDGAPIRELSSMLGEGSLPYRLVPVISLAGRGAQEARDLAFSVAAFGTGYHLEDPTGQYDESLFSKSE